MDAGLIEAVISPQLVDEYEDVLNRATVRAKNRSLTVKDVAVLLARLSSMASIEPPVPLRRSFPRDPDDEHVLNLAIAAQVDFIVSWDNDLLDLGRSDTLRAEHPAIKIVDPVEFLREMVDIRS
jgi:putative PIN family toxin of toxin-antitoxin system